MRSIRVAAWALIVLFMSGLVCGQDAPSGADQLRAAQVRLAEAIAVKLKELFQMVEADQKAIASIKETIPADDEVKKKQVKELENGLAALTVRLAELNKSHADLAVRIDEGEKELSERITELERKVDAASKDMAKVSDEVTNLQDDLLRPAETANIAVLVVSENTEELKLEKGLAAVLRQPDRKVTTSLFKADHLISKGKFRDLFDANAELLRKLDIAKHCDYLVIAKATYSVTTNPYLQGEHHADAHMEVHIIRLMGPVLFDPVIYSGTGKGTFGEEGKEEVKDLADKDMIEQMKTGDFSAIR